MKKIFLIFSIFSFLSLGLFAQKTEVSENFDAKTAFDGNWSTSGSWALSTSSLETTNITANVKNAYLNDGGTAVDDIVYSYSLPENTYDDKTPTRDISFYWLTDMSANANANLYVYVQTSTDNSFWSTVASKQLDTQTDYESVVDSSESIGAADWTTYSGETNATKKWRHAIISNISVSSSAKYMRVRFYYQNVSGSSTPGGGWYVDNVEVSNTRPISTMDFFEDFNNISFTSGEWTESSTNSNYTWVDSTFAYDNNNFPGNTNAAFIEGTNLSVQDETIMFTHNLEAKPNTGVKKWELSFYWRTDMSLNNGDKADITLGLKTSTDGTNYGSISTIWKEDDQSIFETTVDGANSEDNSPTWNEYQAETSSTWKWYHAKVDLTSYIGSSIKAIKLVLNYKGQYAGDFMMDGLMLAKTANPEYQVHFALNNYETVPLEQVDTGYTINYSVVNNGDSAATSVATLDLHVKGLKPDGVTLNGTYNGNTYKQFTISTVAGADASGIYTFNPADFIPSDSSGQNIVGTYTYWIEGSITTPNNTTTFNSVNNGGTFKIDLNKYTNYDSNAGGGTVNEDTISKGFGSIFYLRKTDHFKGIKMDRTAATQGNKVKYYVYQVADLMGANPVFMYEADPSANETDTMATMDEHIKLSAGYYMVFVTAYNGNLAFYTDTTESSNTSYFTGKPNNWTKVTGQGDIALTMLLRENQAFKFSPTAGMVYNPSSLVLTEGVEVDFKLKASDPDDDPGTFDFTGAPSWVSQTVPTDTSVSVSMLPTRFDVGTYSFSVDGTDGKVADKYNISVEVKDTKVLDASTDNYTDNFSAFGDWTNVNDYNLQIASTPPSGEHWTVTGGHMQVSCDKTRDQKEVLYTPLYGVPVSNSSDKLLLFFTWQFDNLSNTGAADIADIKIEMYKKGGTLIKTIWQDDDTTTIGTNTVKGPHFSSMQNFNAENKIVNAYEAATEYTTMVDLTANIADSIYFVITYTSPVTSASQTPVFWFDNFKVNYVPAVLDLKVDANSGYPENKYTQIPLYQAADLAYSVDVQNLSNVAKTGNSLVAKVTNTTNSDQLYEVYTYDVSPLTTTNITLNTKLQPRDIGTYTFDYDISDDAGGDLSGTSTLGITSNEMALDDGSVSNYAKQNDKSNSLGAKFVLRKDDYLQKIKAYIWYYGSGKGYTFSVIKAGLSNTLVWTSNVYTNNPSGFGTYTLTEPVKLTAGVYYLMINHLSKETASDLYVGVDDNADNMGKYYRGDLNSIYEATDYTNTTYPDYKGDLMLRMILFNNPPDVASIADQNATENKLFSVQVGASDKEGDAITYNVTNKPIWLSFDASTATFLGTPSGTDAGDHYVEFYATDGRDSTVNTFKITVAKDPLPYFTTVPVTELVDGQTYNYTAHAADFNGQVVTISTEGTLPNGLTATGTDATYTITGTLAVGQHFVQLRATDSNGGFVVQSFMINVTANNAPYFISKGITHIYSGEAYNLNVVAKDDNSSDVLAITAKSTLPSWLTLTDNGDGTAILTGTAPDSVAGTSTIKLQVVDNFGALDSLVFDLTVEVRVKPVITAIPDTTVKTLQVFSTKVSATDANGDELVISAVSKPNWISFAGLNDGTAKLNGTPTEAGTYKVALLASDGYLMSDTVSFTITVIANPNIAPALGATPDITIMTGTNFKYTVSATDADGDELRFIGTSIPNWLNIQDNMDGTADIIGEPDEANIGVYTVTVGVSDGVNSVEQSFVVTVNAASTGAKKSTEVMVYPNPSKQYITIDNAEKASIKIFSLSGKLLKEITNANIRQNIDVSGINPGIYLIKIKKENEIITQKINIVK